MTPSTSTSTTLSTTASTTPSVASSLRVVQQRIFASQQEYARVTGSVQLLAVTKTQDCDRVREAIAAGQRHFAENYLQEALPKMAAITEPDIVWHFIGPIQSNKTRELATHFDWIHSVDRLKIARRLHEQRPANKAALNVLLQVNISAEASKSGVSLTELPALAAEVATLSRIKLVGLMAIPAPSPDFNAQRQTFRFLAQARDALVRAGHSDCQHLSIGMSQDFVAAIAEGATMVRIGTDIFGARPASTATPD